MLQGSHHIGQCKAKLAALEVPHIVRYQMLDSTSHSQVHHMVIRRIW